MKYIILNDLQTVKKSLKIILLYGGILVFSVFILSQFQFDNEYFKIYTMVLGLSFDLNNIASVSFFVLNMMFTFYLAMKLFTKDILIGNTNLFLRMNIQKWTIYKIVMLFLELAFLKGILHLVIGLCCHLTPMYVVTDILFSFSVALMIIFILMITYRYVIIILLFMLLLYIIYIYHLTIIHLTAFIGYIGFIIVLEIVLLLLFQKRILKLFNLGGKL